MIFLSHIRSDAAFARSLTDKLSDAGYKVWSADQLLPGVNWGAEVGKALERSDTMLLLISPQSIKSDWFTKDLEYALSNVKFKDRLFAVEVKPTPEEDVPWILRNLQFIKAHTPDAASRRIAKLLREGAAAARN
jgi:hypothetical protein